MAKIAVVGAGPMGLTVTYRLLKMGHQVTLFEADNIVGGMSASFDFDGIKIERFYHFLCRSDYPLFDLLEDLGIEDSLRWQDTYMGYYWNKTTRDWGDPFALLKFPGLSLLSKVRYGLMAFTSTKRSNWKKLDGVDAVTWLRKWVGQEAYDVLWKPLFELKFHQYTNNLSAAWIWSRLKRVGSSRRHLLQESLGYLEGGSDTFLYRIKGAIEALSGEIRLATPVTKITINNGKTTGINTEQGHESFDRVVSTVPLPYVPDILEDLPAATRERYRSVENIAVVCVLAKLKKPLSKYFWLNVSDESMDIPGVVEYTRLRPLKDHIVYVPFYLPGDHPKYLEDNEVFTSKVRSYLKQINPDLSDEDILTIKAGRYRYAQPICPPNFLEQLPPINPGVEGLYVADTSYYYPEDRSISESIKLGNLLASMSGE